MKQALTDALNERGYDTLTQVQVAVSDADLIGKDLLVSAQTGSGKTLGFGLAIAPTLLGDDEHFAAAAAPLALIIAPTRELALQVKRELDWLYAKAGATLASCVGGMDMRDERRALARGAHVVVATPGRLRDHIMRGSIDLSELRAVVLDEADEMLDLGFREDLEFILGEAPEERQTLLFSATVPNSIGSLAKNYQKDAIRITTKAENSQHSDIEYHAMMVSDRDSENAIINTLRFYEAPNAIVFCNTRAMVNRLTTRLSNRGFSVVALSGELSQSERTHALQAMRDGRARVCVATDVAARGIDLPNLDLVVHAELPTGSETLLHRSGRTGRAGRKGVSALIVPPKARKKAERLLKWAKLNASWDGAPTADAVKANDEARMLADPHWNEEIADSDQGTIAKLMEQFTPEQLASAYLKLYHSRHSAPEELSAVDAREKPKPREAFGPSVWFSLAGGHDAEAEPRRLLPMLCKAGNITKDDIGAIRVQQSESFIELRESSVAGFLEALGPGLNVEGDALTQLDTPPVIAKSPRPAFGDKKRGPRSDRSDRRDGRRDDRRDDRRSGPRPDRNSDKRDDRKRDDKPAPRKDKWHADDAAAPKPRTKSKSASTPPTDWNDSPEPRSRKPKPQDRKGPPAKGKGKPPFKGNEKPADKRDGPSKPKFSADPSKSLRSKPGNKPKGPPPPKGKPNSKKNKARAAAKPGGKQGGTTPPRRK
nr:DEAD/DEAH box helicase [Roseovarius albus]